LTLDTDPTLMSSLLTRLAAGDAAAGEELFPLLYQDLRDRAVAVMRSERSDHTLQPTALVHEAWIKLATPVGTGGDGFEGRAHFLGVAARAMRQVLVDHARRKQASKRNEGGERVTLDRALAFYAHEGIDLIDLEEALVALAAEDAELGQLVELRFFGGLEVREVAQLLGVSHRRIERGWVFARTWLKRRLGRGEGSDARL
jgi:RNA polymerase sigma-70 factor (ECF subfamily)